MGTGLDEMEGGLGIRGVFGALGGIYILGREGGGPNGVGVVGVLRKEYPTLPPSI